MLKKHWVYNSWLLDIEKEKPKTTEVKRADTTSKPRDSIVKKTNLGKLRELDL